MSNLEAAGIKWHPGFYSAAELEFLTNKDDLEFQREYNLSREPIRMDLLVIKKLSAVSIQNELGHLFRKYNVIEYKSPDDGLSIDDYYKTTGYACLYKSSGKATDQIPAGEVSISIFREAYPRELFKKLENTGSIIKEYRPGIYYITGKNVLFDTQVIVTGRLAQGGHSSLRILSHRAKEEDVKRFLNEAVRLVKPGDKSNMDAVLKVSVLANQKVYEGIRREQNMCDELKELMKEEFDKVREEKDREYAKMQEDFVKISEEKDREYAKVKEDNAEMQKIMSSMVKNLMASMQLTAEQAMVALKIPDAYREKCIVK